jgi:nucleoside-diphosphate-sugar epimerase
MIAQSLAWLYAPGRRPHGEGDPLAAADADLAIVLDGVRALEGAVLETPGIEGVVLRYGLLYGPGTSSRVPQDPCPLHVQAAARAAFLAIERGRPGIYNVADDDALVSTAKARRELGWEPMQPACRADA